MATLPDVVKQSELLNQLVLNRSTMEELGRVEVLWMYPPAHRVLGFVCKSGFLGNKKSAFKLSQVEAIGTNGVLTHSQPDPTDAEHVRQLESLIHCELWSNAGHKLGKIIDCVFSLRNGVISDYLVVSDRLSTLTSGIYRLPPAKIVSIGRRRVLVAETALQEFAPYQEGIQQKLTKVSNLLKEDYEQVTHDLRSLAKRAQETTHERTIRLKTLAEQAKERAQLLAEQARERAQELSEHLAENVQTLAEQARETSETIAEQVQYTTQEWSEHLKDTTETLTVQAREVFEDAEDDRPSTSVSSDFDDFDLLFEDVPETKLPSTSVSPRPVEASPVTPIHPTATPSPSTAQETEESLPSSDADPWNFGEPPANSNDRFEIDDSWDVEDDPWDITQPPIASLDDVSPTAEAISPRVEEGIREEKSESLTDEEEDEPWV